VSGPEGWVTRHLRQFGHWLAWRNPLLHGLIVGLALDTAADFAWGNGNVNIATLVVGFTVTAVASFRLQRRAVRRELQRQPIYAGTVLDADGTALVHILAPVTDDPSRWHDVLPRAEWLWARALGNGSFRIRSVPVLADGLSFGDVVRCIISSDSDPPLVEAVRQWGGHRTVQVRLAEPDAFDLDQLPLDVSAGAWVSGPHFAVDVHPEEDWESVAAHLDDLQAAGALEWVEASALPIAAARNALR